MSKQRKPRCPACNRRDCKGWQAGDPEHEYRGKGSWFLGCHCAGCSRARAESGGFFGAMADALSSTARQQQEGE